MPAESRAPAPAGTDPDAKPLTWRLRLFKALLARVFRVLFRIEVKGLEHFHALGDRAILVVNHQSFLDAPILAALLPERVSFAINSYIAQRWWVNPWLSIVHAFRIDPTSPYATATIIKSLRKGGKCVIFPEGRLTETGALMKIYDGPALVADKTGAEVLPIRIEGAQYSKVSRLAGKVRQHWLPRITVTILPARRLSLPPELKGRRRRQHAGAWLYDVMSDTRFETAERFPSLFEAVLAARAQHGGDLPVLEDMAWQPMSYDRLRLATMVLGRRFESFTEPGERVGLLMPNAIGTIAAFFGLSAFGRVPAILNFTAGAAALASACRTAQIRTVITSAQFLERGHLQETAARLGESVRVVLLEDIRKSIGRREKVRGLLEARFARTIHRRYAGSPDDPAVILFTSGSEGEPKGVVLSHDNLLANCRQAAARIDFTPADVVLNVLPVFHAFGLTAGTLLPMVSGVKTFLYPSPLHYRMVPEVAYGCNATIMFGTDTFLNGYARSAHVYDFYRMRYVFAGAEPLREETRRLWFTRFGLRLFEGYGVTEAAPVVALNTPMHYRPGTVGRLLPGLRHRLVPVEGIAAGGRLHLTGPNIMQGYLRPDQPGRLEPVAEGWYDTGDVVDIDPDGFVTIVGRAKRFAKIGGEMVSLAVAEGLAAAVWPDHQHAVVVVADPRKGEQLALVTTRADAERGPLVEQAHRSGAGDLTVPRVLVPVEALPLLGSGKIDYVKVKAVADETMARRQAA